MAGSTRRAAHARTPRPAGPAGYAHGRVPRAVREEQVLALAEELFAEHGYAGASMDELARRAGVSKPVVYALVRSKDHLFAMCVERLAGQLEEAVATAAGSAGDAEARLRAGIAAFLEFVAAHRREWEVLAGETGQVAAQAARVRGRQMDLVTSLLVAGAAELGADVDTLRAEATAHLINGAMEALARWWGRHPEVGTEELTRWAGELLVPGLRQMVQDHRPNP